MIRAGVIAANTFRELARSKLLYLLLVFSLLLILGSISLTQLTIGQWSRVVLNVGLATVHISGALVAIMVGVGIIAGEVERKTVYVTLAKPLPRWQFVLGRYLGLVTVLAILVSVMGACIAAVLTTVKEPVSVTMVYALVLTFVELALLAAVAVVFSTFTTTTLATIFSVSLFLIGHASGDLSVFANESGGFIGTLLAGFARVFPNLELLNVKSQAANHLPVESAFVMGGVVYGALWAAALLVFASFLFARRDLK